MDCEFIEQLVLKAKNNDESAKEKIIDEFKPFIFTFCKKIHLDGYDKEDLHSECFSTLLKCIKLYKPVFHRFAAYGTNSIKNSIYSLLRIQKRKKSLIEVDNLPFEPNLDNHDSNKSYEYTNPFTHINNKITLEKALNSLNHEDRELIYYLYFKDITLKEYCKYHNINYYKCLRRKKFLLAKLFNLLNSNIKSPE